jgi:serine/threonine protein kinase
MAAAAAATSTAAFVPDLSLLSIEDEATFHAKLPPVSESGRRVFVIKKTKKTGKTYVVPSLFDFGGQIYRVAKGPDGLLGAGVNGIGLRAFHISDEDESGPAVAIKYFFNKMELPNLKSTIQECNIQAILAQHGFAPTLFHVGWNPEKNRLYLCSEILAGRFDHLIMGNTKEQNDIDVPDALIQIARMLQTLGTEYKFNHRDLKSDNIMYKIVDGHIKMQLIDFGMSCMEIKPYSLLNPGFEAYFGPRKCYNKSRDLAQLIYNITDTNEADEPFKLNTFLSERLKAVLTPLIADVPKGWLATYGPVMDDRASSPTPPSSPSSSAAAGAVVAGASSAASAATFAKTTPRHVVAAMTAFLAGGGGGGGGGGGAGAGATSAAASSTRRGRRGARCTRRSNRR